HQSASRDHMALGERRLQSHYTRNGGHRGCRKTVRNVAAQIEKRVGRLAPKTQYTCDVLRTWRRRVPHQASPIERIESIESVGRRMSAQENGATQSNSTMERRRISLTTPVTIAQGLCTDFASS